MPLDQQPYSFSVKRCTTSKKESEIACSKKSWQRTSSSKGEIYLHVVLLILVGLVTQFLGNLFLNGGIATDSDPTTQYQTNHHSFHTIPQQHVHLHSLSLLMFQGVLDLPVCCGHQVCTQNRERGEHQDVRQHIHHLHAPVEP